LTMSSNNASSPNDSDPATVLSDQSGADESAEEGGAGTPQPDPGPSVFPEDEPFWFAFSLAVAAASPSGLAHAAALVSVATGVHLMATFAGIREEIVLEDAALARFTTLGLAVVTVSFKFSHYSLLGLLWMMVCMFFFNSVSNVRTMLRVAEKRRSAGGARKHGDSKGKDSV